ncbi:MAG: spore maturation protein [Verrucomicrobiae bacterium]|nr:spore maturation protein [Verrucomicrobiae bacterium]
MKDGFLCKTETMLNYIWIFLVLSAVLIGGVRFQYREMAEGMIKAAESAVTVAIGLIGIMAMWLGVMRVAERAGVVAVFSRFLKPILKWLFPEVPDGHPAMCSMLMNIAANMLGLSNAATPLGLRAMKDLQSLNPNPSVATNAMCTFLAINTSSVQLIPMTAVAILATTGSQNPTAIVGTSLIATLFSTVAGIMSVKIMEKWKMFRVNGNGIGVNDSKSISDAPEKNSEIQIKDNQSCEKISKKEFEYHVETTELFAMRSFSFFGKIALITFILFFAVIFILMILSDSSFAVNGAIRSSSLFVRAVETISILAIPFLFSLFTLIATLRGVRVYEEFIIGAKEGFDVAVRIIPYLVAILVAIGMFKSAGGIDIISNLLKPILDLIGFPSELLPMAIMRPLSGSATLGIFTDIVKQFGPDSMIARMAGTLYGSTETTFYVVAIYFGSVNIRKMRHSIAAGLIADLAGIIAAVIVCRFVFAG